MDEGLRVCDRALLHQIGPKLARQVELDVDVQRLGNVDAAVTALGRVVQLAIRRVAGAGVVPGVGALQRRAAKRFEHRDVERGLKLLQKHPQRGAHDAGSDEDDIWFRGVMISDHELLRRTRAARARTRADAHTSAATPITISTMPSAFARRRRLLEHERRDRLREQHLDQRERAHAGGGGEREGQEPELRGERAEEAGEQRRPPVPRDRAQHLGLAQQQPEPTAARTG